MQNPKLYMYCLEHKVEVLLDLPDGCKVTYDFIPCSVVDCFSDLIKAGQRQGTFSNVPDDEVAAGQGGYWLCGSWRIVPLDYNPLHRIMMWWNNGYDPASFNHELFIRYFGPEAGPEYYDRWINHSRENLLDMLGTFASNQEDGQLFCDLIMEQVEQYEQIEK